MTTDYPDWTRLFYLTGTAITIPINIVASEVTLPVSIDAATVTFDVNIVASDITMPVSIDAATVTLDVNLTAATATIDINFLDQSVAVFDANQWFALQALQVFVTGIISVPDNTLTTLLSRTVPAGKTMFITGFAYGLYQPSAFPNAMLAQLRIGADPVCYEGSYRGHGLTLDTPLRVTAGQVVYLSLVHSGASGALTCVASLWGYDRPT